MRRADLLPVGLGGIVGSAVRWFVAEQFTTDGFPWHTLTVNVVGCLLLAVVLTRVHTIGAQRLLGVGFCGGLTTFSTFSIELVELLDGGHWLTALAYLCASLVLGLAGFTITRRTLLSEVGAS